MNFFCNTCRRCSAGQMLQMLFVSCNRNSKQVRYLLLCGFVDMDEVIPDHKVGRILVPRLTGLAGQRFGLAPAIALSLRVVHTLVAPFVLDEADDRPRRRRQRAHLRPRRGNRRTRRGTSNMLQVFFARILQFNTCSVRRSTTFVLIMPRPRRIGVQFRRREECPGAQGIPDSDSSGAGIVAGTVGVGVQIERNAVRAALESARGEEEARPP